MLELLSRASLAKSEASVFLCCTSPGAKARASLGAGDKRLDTPPAGAADSAAQRQAAFLQDSAGGYGWRPDGRVLAFVLGEGEGKARAGVDSGAAVMLRRGGQAGQRGAGAPFWSSTPRFRDGDIRRADLWSATPPRLDVPPSQLVQSSFGRQLGGSPTAPAFSFSRLARASPDFPSRCGALSSDGAIHDALTASHFSTPLTPSPSRPSSRPASPSRVSPASTRTLLSQGPQPRGSPAGAAPRAPRSQAPRPPSEPGSVEELLWGAGAHAAAFPVEGPRGEGCEASKLGAMETDGSRDPATRWLR